MIDPRSTRRPHHDPDADNGTASSLPEPDGRLVDPKTTELWLARGSVLGRVLSRLCSLGMSRSRHANLTDRRDAERPAGGTRQHPQTGS